MTEEEIQRIYQQYETPKHVISHMEKVAELCETIADRLIEKGYEIDKENLIDAAKLHDFLRFIDFRTQQEQEPAIWLELRAKYQKIGHEKAAAQILESMGEKKIANIVAMHDFFQIDRLESWEQKILYYADKRVEGDKIVSLRERFYHGRKRNFSHLDDLGEIADIERKIYQLQEKFKNLGINTNLL